jgi:hypothetical protein
MVGGAQSQSSNFWIFKMNLQAIEVVAAFHAALGRAPESAAVIDEHRQLESLEALGAHLRASEEFAQRFGGMFQLPQVQQLPSKKIH